MSEYLSSIKETLFPSQPNTNLVTEQKKVEEEQTMTNVPNGKLTFYFKTSLLLIYTFSGVPSYLIPLRK